LHLEDDDNDSWFFQHALKGLAFTGVYRRVGNVTAALEYLAGSAKYSDRQQFPIPDVLVVDTTAGGAQTTDDLFAWLDVRPEFESLVKVALTGGISPAAQTNLLGHGIAAVLSKGASIAEFTTGVADVLSRCVR
jgi:hypothetical protein